MKKILFLFAFTAFLSSCKNETKTEENSQTAQAETDLSTSQKIANANGFENFEKVKEIDFTFNVKVGDTLRSSRAWKWYPKENKVAMTEKDSTASYY